MTDCVCLHVRPQVVHGNQGSRSDQIRSRGAGNLIIWEPSATECVQRASICRRDARTPCSLHFTHPNWLCVSTGYPCRFNSLGVSENVRAIRNGVLRLLRFTLTHRRTDGRGGGFGCGPRNNNNVLSVREVTRKICGMRGVQ